MSTLYWWTATSGTMLVTWGVTLVWDLTGAAILVWVTVSAWAGPRVLGAGGMAAYGAGAAGMAGEGGLWSQRGSGELRQHRRWLAGGWSLVRQQRTGDQRQRKLLRSGRFSVQQHRTPHGSGQLEVQQRRSGESGRPQQGRMPRGRSRSVQLRVQRSQSWPGGLLGLPWHRPGRHRQPQICSCFCSPVQK